jgi:non-ribosomal peptide synthetase component F
VQYADFALWQLSTALEDRARHAGASPFMTVAAAFAAALHRWSGAVDVRIGIPVAGRERPELEGLIGFFVNTVVLRIDLAGRPTFRELLARTRSTVLDAFAHQEVPFEKVVEAVRPQRIAGRNPLFDVMLAFQDAADHEEEGELLREEFDLGGLHQGGGKTVFDLILNVTRRRNGLTAALTYNIDLLDRASAAAMARQLTALLEAAVAAPERPLADLPLPQTNERERRLLDGSGRRRGRAATEGSAAPREAGVAARSVALERRRSGLSHAKRALLTRRFASAGGGEREEGQESHG